MHRRYRPTLCVEVLEARLALSVSPAPAAEPPDGVVTVEVGPEPVAVGTDESGEVLYMISMPPSQKCMCRVCLGTWDGPPRGAGAAEPPAASVGESPVTTEVGVVIADRAVVMADRTGTPDVIVEAAAAPAGGPVALPPGATTTPWQVPEMSPPDSPRGADGDVAGDQFVAPAASADPEPVGDLVAAPTAEPEVDALALGV